MSLEKGQKIGRQYLNFVTVVTDSTYCARFFKELHPLATVTKSSFDLHHLARKGLRDRYGQVYAFRSKQL